MVLHLQISTYGTFICDVNIEWKA